MLYRISSMWLQHLSTLRPSLRCLFCFFLMLLILSQETKQHTLRSCNELTIDVGLAQPWHKASQYALSDTKLHIAFHSIADHARICTNKQKKFSKMTEHEMTPRFFPWYIAHQINNLHSCTTHYVQNKGPNISCSSVLRAQRLSHSANGVTPFEAPFCHSTTAFIWLASICIIKNCICQEDYATLLACMVFMTLKYQACRVKASRYL